MKRKIFSLALVLVSASLLAPKSVADADPLAAVLKHEGHTVALDLKFSRKKKSSMQHVFSLLDYGPNGHATGFVVGDGLVMTAYHVVSGNLSASKKGQLKFAPGEKLDVKVSVNGCEATVLMVDEEADLALLRVCRTQKQATAPAFQASLNKDEKLLLIARPNGDKMVRRGTCSGTYMHRGQQYWSAKIEGRDGYSGSPVYNDRAEIVGVFSGYDWTQKLAVISPGIRAQKLLEDYASSLRTNAASGARP